jgi:murein DD-endopeptidase MepM/ murein hydrolase activator NlpD
MVYLYKKSNSVYDKEKIDNLKAIIFSWDDISKIINDMHYKAIIEVTWKTLIDNHRKFISQLYIKTLELWQEEKDLKKLRKELILARKVLNDKKDYKKQILAISRWKENLYEKYITDKIALEKQVKAKLFKEQLKFNSIKDTLLQKYDCKLLNWPKTELEATWLNDKCYKLNKVITNESLLKWFDNWSDVNIFNWPIYPAKWLSTFFRDSWYKTRFWSEHDAIDIPAPQWTSIVMPADWYVIYMNRPTTTDYSYLVMKHSDWFVSVYWHLSEILVNELDFVEKWKIIAKSWWEYGTLWAWVMTTWPHLHYEIFKDKLYVDPLNYMDISLLPFNNLLDKYKMKYMVDFKARKWYDYSSQDTKTWTFVLDWSSEVERQKSLISKYANKNFSDWNMWVEEAIDWNIDPSFLMCLWLAETWLGRNMKTPYNVWNVWNTDSWAVQYYYSSRAWIYAIVKTLNNRFLWWYNSISDLSRYWNKNGSIYASSPDHWHNNIVKCMSHIKWTYIPDDYNFRLIR